MKYININIKDNEQMPQKMKSRRPTPRHNKPTKSDKHIEYNTQQEQETHSFQVEMGHLPGETICQATN